MRKLKRIFSCFLSRRVSDRLYRLQRYRGRLYGLEMAAGYYQLRDKALAMGANESAWRYDQLAKSWDKP